MLAPSTSDETVWHQFQHLPDQHHSRLLQKHQKQQGGAKKLPERKAGKDVNLPFGPSDNLDLKLSHQHSEPLVSESFQEPGEQIRELKDENGRLYKLLREKDQEIRQMKKKQDVEKALVAAGASAITNDNAATKIVDLSKKVRELTAEVESERTKSKILARKCQELERELTDDSQQRKSVEVENKELNQDELKATQEKLKQSECRVMDLRNQVQSLKAELKVSQKILAQEVGDGVSVQTLLSDSSTWKGRAQQIVALQKKVNELRKQLDQKQDHGSQGDISSIGSQRDFVDETFSIASQRSTLNNLTERQKLQIRKLEKQRKENQERLAEELKTLEQQNTELRQKVEASKARNNSLSEEMKILKKQNQLLTEKGKHDNELIEMLMKQQSQWKKLAEENNRKMQNDTEDAQKMQKNFSANNQLERNTIEHLKTIIKEKEQHIKSMEAEIKHKSFTKSGDYETFSATVNSAEGPKVLTEAEILAEVLSPNSSRSASRSDSHIQVKPKGDYHELNSLYQASTVERDRLSELVHVLEKRIQEATVKMVDVQGELQAERRRNVLLEKQLGKAKLDRSSTDSKQRSKKAGFSAGIGGSVTLEDTAETFGGLDELQMRLDIQKDENEALKAALQSTLKAKEEDLHLYTDMLDETKKVFLQGIRQSRQSTT